MLSLPVFTRRSAILTAAFTLGVYAQQQPELMHMTMVKVHPGMGPEWLELQAQAKAAYQKDGVPWRHVWVPAVFGDAVYYTVFPVGKMERYESPNPMRKTMKEAEYNLYVRRMTRVLSSSQSVLATSRPDLGLGSGRAKPVRAVATTVVVEPGKNMAFEAFVKSELRPAWQKAGMKEVWVAQMLLGGSTTEYVVLYLFDKWSEMEGGSPMERALGKQAWDQVRQKIAGLATSVRNEVIALDQDLSYLPQ